VLLPAAVFLPAVRGEFVNLDDISYFVSNPNWRGLGRDQLAWMWGSMFKANYNPLAWMTWGLDYVFWGMNPIGYHLTNIFWHLANSVLVYLLARRLWAFIFKDPVDRTDHRLTLAAAFAALLFAVHPLRAESVAWISERRDVLSGFFLLGSVLLYLRAVGKEPVRKKTLAASVIVYVMALLSKASILGFPLVLLLLDIYPLRRLSARPTEWRMPAAKARLVEKIPYLAASLAAALLAMVAVVRGKGLVASEAYGLTARLAMAGYSVFFYVRKTLWPAGLLPLYERPAQIDPWAEPYLLGGLFVVAVTVIFAAQRQRRPGLLVAWLSSLVLLAPVSGLIPIGSHLVANRYTYHAGLPWVFVGGAAFVLLWRRGGQVRTLAAGGAAALVALLSVLTYRQAAIWRTSETLWRYALSIEPRNYTAQYSMGHALGVQNRFEEALPYLQRALELKPKSTEALNNLGNTLKGLGRHTEAVDAYRQALALNPGYPEALFNLAESLHALGDPAAASTLEQALRLKPSLAGGAPPAQLLAGPPGTGASAQTYLDLGVAAHRRKQLAEAMEYYRKAIALDPSSAAAYNNLGNALASQERWPEALAQLQKAIRADPRFATAHYNLGHVLSKMGRTQEAAAEWRHALEINPSYEKARRRLQELQKF
jgi:tetratricopeptide (TPR) repeat protein